MDCIYCDRVNKQRDQMMVPVMELKGTMLYISRNQAHPGHCVLAAKEHVSALQECTEQQKKDITEDLGLISGLIRKITGSKCMSVTAATNRDTPYHLHYHLLPQYEGEEDPLTGDEQEPVTLSEDESQQMIGMFSTLIQYEWKNNSPSDE